MISSVLQILMVNQYKKDNDSCMLEVSFKQDGIRDLVSVTDPYGEPIQEGQGPYGEPIQEGQGQPYVRGKF